MGSKYCLSRRRWSPRWRRRRLNFSPGAKSLSSRRMTSNRVFVFPLIMIRPTVISWFSMMRNSRSSSRDLEFRIIENQEITVGRIMINGDLLVLDDAELEVQFAGPGDERRHRLHLGEDVGALT